MANPNEFKVTTQELIAVANGIRVLMGQPAQTNPYEWTTDYIVNLKQIKSILQNLSDIIIGEDEELQFIYAPQEGGDYVYDEQNDKYRPAKPNEEGTHIRIPGPAGEIQNKIEEVQDRLNEIIDPNHSQTDKPIFNAIDDIENLVDRLDDIVDDDPDHPTGQTPAELIENIEDNKEILEDIVNPGYPYYFVVEDDEWKRIYPTPEDLEEHTVEDISVNPIESELPTDEYSEDVIYKFDQPSEPLDDVVNEIKDAIDDIRETVPDPDAELGDPDERTIEEIAEDVADAINKKDELEQLLRDIEEIIHQGAVYTEEEDPTTYHYVVVNGEWKSISEEEIDPLIYTEEDEITFQPSDGDEAGEDYNEYTVYSFTESQKSVDDYFDTKAEEIYELMENQELEWEDLTDDQKLIIIFDDLLDAYEGTKESLDEYQNGNFQIISTSRSTESLEIFQEIEDIERGIRENLTEEQKQEEAFVIYVARCLFYMNESFICTGFVDGKREEGSLFYGDSKIRKFYNTSSPTMDAKLGRGKYLIRVVLKQQTIEEE